MRKILIIKDEQVLAEKCREKLLQEDFEVQIARSAEEGLELLRRENPDLVLLDILLPKGNATYFLQKMKKSSMAATPVIAFSDYDDPEIKFQAKDLGAEHYVVRKNLTFNRIINKIKEVSSKSL